MSKLNLPGFTAEASLYKTSGRYYGLGTVGQINEVIHPAQAGDPNCFKTCFNSCWWKWNALGLGYLASSLCTTGCISACGGQCKHIKTDTFCAGFVFLCNDISLCADGSVHSSGWYPCGLCFGAG